MRAAKAAKEDDPVVPTGYDVVFGRGGGATILSREYVGNNRLCVDVDIHRERYRVAGRDGRREIVLSIVDTVRGSGGRFLRTDNAAGSGGGGRQRPFEIMRDERLVRERVSEALREASSQEEAGGGPKSPPAATAAAKRAKGKRSSTKKPTADPATVARLLATQIEIRSEMEREANLAGDESDDDDDDDDASAGKDESQGK